jgi:hypothetical protein
MPSGPLSIELAGILHELSARLLSADGMTQALERLATLTAAAVPGALRCSVALIGERSPLTLTAHGEPGKAVDDHQYATGHGPGLDAARTRAVITSLDLCADDRWPDLTDRARVDGVHAVAAIPLDVERAAVGSVSLYLSGPHDLDPELLLTAMAIVNQAEVLLGEVRRRESWTEGATVDRAVGVLIAQRGCGVTEAYDVLSETAHRLGIDRHALAQRLITAATRGADN